jgi:hypothetical protein
MNLKMGEHLSFDKEEIIPRLGKKTNSIFVM